MIRDTYLKIKDSPFVIRMMRGPKERHRTQSDSIDIVRYKIITNLILRTYVIMLREKIGYYLIWKRQENLAEDDLGKRRENQYRPFVRKD